MQFLDNYCIFCVIIKYYFIFGSNYSRFGYWELARLAPVSIWNIPIVVGFFEHFFVFGTIRYSRFISDISCPSARISQFSKELWYFYQRLVLEKKFFLLSVPLDTKVSFLLGPLSWENKKMCVCIYQPVHTHMHINSSIYIYLYLYWMKNEIILMFLVPVC